MMLPCPNCGHLLAGNAQVKGLTRRETDVFNFVRAFKLANSRWPKYREVWEGCGFNSRHAFSRIFRALQEKKRLEWCGRQYITVCEVTL